MTVITIQCLLQAKEETLCYLWNLMIEKNTLLVSEILERIKTHQELDAWIAQGYIPVTAIDKITKQLKQQPKYNKMPGRFSTSAETLVKDIYKSWFAVQRKKRNKLWGKTRWLTIIKSEQELIEATKLSLSELQAEAKKILKREQKKYDKLKQNKNSETEVSKDLFGHLIKIYEKITTNYEKEKKSHLKAKKLIQRCAVVYLLKNKLEFANQPEDPEKYERYKRKKEIQIERLDEQLKARLPRGRNLTKDEYLKALEQAKSLITRNEEMEMLQARLLRSNKLIPFPVSYNTNVEYLLVTK